MAKFKYSEHVEYSSDKDKYFIKILDKDGLNTGKVMWGSYSELDKLGGQEVPKEVLRKKGLIDSPGDKPGPGDYPSYPGSEPADAPPTQSSVEHPAVNANSGPAPYTGPPQEFVDGFNKWKQDYNVPNASADDYVAWLNNPLPPSGVTAEGIQDYQNWLAQGYQGDAVAFAAWKQNPYPAPGVTQQVMQEFIAWQSQPGNEQKTAADWKAEVEAARSAPPQPTPGANPETPPTTGQPSDTPELKGPGLPVYEPDPDKPGSTKYVGRDYNGDGKVDTPPSAAPTNSVGNTGAQPGNNNLLSQEAYEQQQFENWKIATLNPGASQQQYKAAQATYNNDLDDNGRTYVDNVATQNIKAFNDWKIATDNPNGTIEQYHQALYVYHNVLDDNGRTYVDNMAKQKLDAAAGNASGGSPTIDSTNIAGSVSIPGPATEGLDAPLNY